MVITRQAENAPELNTRDSIFKSVSVCSPEVEFSQVNHLKTSTLLKYHFVQVNIVTNRQCLMKLLAPVDPSIVYTSNKCFK